MILELKNQEKLSMMLELNNQEKSHMMFKLKILKSGSRKRQIRNLVPKMSMARPKY